MPMKCPRIALRPWEAIAGTERMNGRCLAEAKVQMSGMDPSGTRIKGQCSNCLTRNYFSGKREIDDLQTFCLLGCRGNAAGFVGQRGLGYTSYVIV